MIHPHYPQAQTQFLHLAASSSSGLGGYLKGFGLALLLTMLVIPFFLYAAARSGSIGLVYFYLGLMMLNMVVAMRSA